MNSECQANSVTTRVGRHERAVGAADQVLDEEILAGRMRQEVGEQRVELRRRHRLVVVPPDMRLGVLVADDELVLGRAAGVLAGLGDQRAMGGQPGFAAADRLFAERCRTEIIADRARRS